MESSRESTGSVTCASWIRRPENAHLVAMGKSMRTTTTTTTTTTKTSLLQIFSFDAKTTSLSSSPQATYECEEGELIISLAVHPSGDEIVCSTSNGNCKILELHGGDGHLKLLAKDMSPFQGVGAQKCLAFSIDGSKFAMGGEDGHLRVFKWPSLSILLDEPKAQKSFRDMDYSLDSEFLATTSNDGSARIWNITDGVPLTSLTRASDEKIECCRFSRDGTKPFLFCTGQKGNKALTSVWDISTWNKIGHKRLLGKPASVLSISVDGKYLALGSKDGDICVVQVKKMEICHWSKRLHPGSGISSLEFCPSERVVLSTSSEWGALATKLGVPADWKEWQIYVLLLGLFLASAVVFYIFLQNSDSFWGLPPQQSRPRQKSEAFFRESAQSSDEQNFWGPLDM